MIKTVLVLTLTVGLTFAQSPCTTASGTGLGSYATAGINLNINGSGLNTQAASAAIAQWNDCITSYVPDITLNQSGTTGAQVQVNLISGNAINGHVGNWDNTEEVITLFTHDSTGNALDDDDLTYVLAHELGHALGLADTSCGLMNGTFDSSNPSVGGEECSFVSNGWRHWFQSCEKVFFMFKVW